LTKIANYRTGRLEVFLPGNLFLPGSQVATGSDDTATDVSPPAHTLATSASGDEQGTIAKSNAEK
jgi:hypothetical protein